MDQSTTTSGKSMRRGTGLWFAIVLGLCFQALCFIRIGADANVLLPNQAVLNSVFDESVWGSSLAVSVAAFVVAHILLAAAFGTACWVLARISMHAWPRALLSCKKWTTAWFAFGASWLVVENAATHRWSSLGEPYFAAVTTRWMGMSLSATITIIMALAVIATFWRAWSPLSGRARTFAAPLFAAASSAARPVQATTLAGIVVVLLLGTIAATVWGEHESRAVRPNVIVIGIDSLRHDIPLSDQSLTPNIDAFMKESMRFSDAITPLARTFPSWVATLTGREPQTTGAFVNLLPRNLIRTGETLPQALGRAGYATQYAIDEVRFSNIDTGYGFDRVIAPKIGASDFVLGTLNDTPLSNLVVNSRLGAWLFPNTYANRAAAATYNPDSFVTRLRHELTSDGPTFSAVHLTLPHWPYYWAESPSRADETVVEIRGLYRNAIQRADIQFADIMNVFRQRGLLDRAIVILMSDHGEAIGLANDYPYSENAEKVNGMTALGHGTSVLSPNQYRVVLGIRLLGFDNHPPPGQIDFPVSLIDVAPTVLDLLALEPADRFDGISLKGMLYGSSDAEATWAHRIRFTQSEFNPRGFQPGKTLSASTLNAIADFYEVDPISDRISLRPQVLPTILRDRQYAALRGSEMLVALPNAARNSFSLFITSRQGGVLTPANNSANLTPEQADLRAALLQRFDAVAKYTAATVSE